MELTKLSTSESLKERKEEKPIPNKGSQLNLRKGNPCETNGPLIEIKCDQYIFQAAVENKIIQEDLIYPLFATSANRIVHIIAVYEKREEPESGDNIRYFIENGIYVHIDYIFILNNDISYSIPEAHNIVILRRYNNSYDFGSYSHGIQLLQHKNYDYYFFHNSSAIGPFIPSYIPMRYDQIFINKFMDGVHLVSPTIILMQDGDNFFNRGFVTGLTKRKVYAICQTCMFVVDAVGFKLLLDQKFFVPRAGMTFNDIILQKECFLSLIMLHNNYNIACLLPEFTGVDFRRIDSMPGQPQYTYRSGYNPIQEMGLFKRTMHPYEVIFHKRSRGRRLNLEAVRSLSQAKVVRASLATTTPPA